MRGIKIPQQEFVLQMQGGGLMREGGLFVGHYGTSHSFYLCLTLATCRKSYFLVILSTNDVNTNAS